MKRIVLITNLLFANATLFGQDSLVTQLLAKHSKPIAITNNSLSGDGAQWLQSQLENTQFVLVGEDHGIAELPQFVGALYSDLYEKGFNHFVTEAAPGALPQLLKMASQPDLSEFESFNKKHPFSIPFYSWQEESEMLRNIYHTNNMASNSIWALDQEFIVSSRAHFEKLAMNAKNATAKKIAQEYQAKATALLDEAIKTQNFGSNLMFTLTPDDFNALTEAFSDQPEAVSLINGLKESQSIYFKMGSDPYQSNIDRIALMKKNFYKYYNKAKETEKLPKAIFKFGAIHTSRGASLLNIFDLGNMASELANSNGKESFHILVVGVEGESNKYMLMNDSSLKNAKYSGKKELNGLGLDPIFDLAEGNEWKMIDLSQLKNDIWLSKIEVSDELKKTVYAYDAVLLIPQVTAATNFE